MATPGREEQEEHVGDVEEVVAVVVEALEDGVAARPEGVDSGTPAVEVIDLLGVDIVDLVAIIDGRSVSPG